MKTFRKAIRNWRLLVIVLLMAASVPALADTPGQYRAPDGTRYWYFEGHWYRWGSGKWAGARAPMGVLVPYIPYYFTVTSSNGIPYYYANDTYYVWNETHRQFQVVAPPDKTTSGGAPQPAPAVRLFVYPKNGQSPAQQTKDRDECARWAVAQTGFDPAAPGAPVPAAQAAQMPDRYVQAQASCLEGRGYVVK